MKKRQNVILKTLLVGLFIIVIIALNVNKLNLTGLSIYQYQPSSLTGQDTYIRNGSTTNFEADTVLKVGYTLLGLEYRSLTDFDVSSIPGSSAVLSAIVELYSTSDNQPNMTINAYMLTTPWNVSTVTWYNATSNSLWVNGGGGDYVLQPLLSSVNITNVNQFYNFSITQAVIQWINGSSPNDGIIFVASAGNNNLTQFASSRNSNSNEAPIIWVNYVQHLNPTINSISTNSNITNPLNVSSVLSFFVNWTSLQSNPSQIFVCNSSAISFPNGCAGITLCNTSLSQTNPATCNYIIQPTDNKTTNFWISVCDSVNCSMANESQFYMDHSPNIMIIHPNGGELINQSVGNYTIQFNVSDIDNNALNASIYYGPTQYSTASPIVTNLPLHNYCTNSGNTAITGACNYPWNSSQIYGTYFLTILLTDSHTMTVESSNSSFLVRSLILLQPPSITSESITPTTATSGQIFQVYANVTDPDLNSVWVSVNGTDGQVNLTMYNITNITFTAGFLAGSAGTYQFKVYATDLVNNINDSMPWETFNVIVPQASTQGELSPEIALPYSVIKVDGDLNASDPLVGVYGYLNVPNGFTFVQASPQNEQLGNFSANQTKEADWFLSTPINQSVYIFNITYTDSAGNSWNSSNTATNVTSSFGSPAYSLSIADYHQVAITNAYFAESTFEQNGVPVDPGSMQVSLYDPLGNLVIGPTNMLKEQTGIYNYTYLTPNSQTAGQWDTVVNATINSVSYYANSF